MRKSIILFSVLIFGLSLLSVNLVNHADKGMTPNPPMQALNPALNEAKLQPSAGMKKPNQEDDTAGCAKTLAELALKLKRLESELALLKQKARDGMADSLNNPDKTNSNQTAFAHEPHSEQELFEEELKQRERAASLENAFRNEGVDDPEWAAKTTASIEKAIAARSANAIQGANVECRSHQCRVELEFTGTARSDQLIDELGQQFAGTFSSIARQQAQLTEGGSSEILYLVR